MPESKESDKSDRLDMIQKLAGSLLTPLTVAIVGFFGSQYLATRQDAETNVRFGAELMSRREEADSALRKDVFIPMFSSFFDPVKVRQPEQTMRNLELIAYNFHESLDLAPLFKVVYKDISAVEAAEERQQFLGQLDRITRHLMTKQVSALEESGGRIGGTILIDELNKNPAGTIVFDDVTLDLKANGQQGIVGEKIIVRVEALELDKDQREAKFRTYIRTPGGVLADVVFWAGLFDFPMPNNIRLQQGYRCAIALREFTNDAVEVAFVYFPASRASLKDKRNVDELIDDLLDTKKRISERK